MPKVVEMMKEGRDKNLELYQEGMEHTEVVIQWQRKRGSEVRSAEQTKRVMFLGSFGRGLVGSVKLQRVCMHGCGERSYSILGPRPQRRSLSD